METIFSRALSHIIAVVWILAAANTAQAQPFAYITNQNSNNVSVINTATDTVVATVAVGTQPTGVAVNPAGTGTPVPVAVISANSSNSMHPSSPPFCFASSVPLSQGRRA